MSRSILALLVAIMLLLAACGGEDAPLQRDAGDLATVRAGSLLPTATASPTATHAPSPTVARATATATQPASSGVAQALLSASDLAGVWTTSSKTTDDFIYGSCNEQDLAAQFSPLDSATQAFVTSSGQWMNERILVLSEADAAAALQVVHESFDCPQRAFPEPNGGQRFWTFRALPMQPMGDDLVAKGFTVTFSNPVYTPLQAGVAVVRSGQIVIQLYYYGFQIDSALTEAFARTALAKAATYQP